MEEGREALGEGKEPLTFGLGEIRNRVNVILYVGIKMSIFSYRELKKRIKILNLFLKMQDLPYLIKILDNAPPNTVV